MKPQHVVCFSGGHSSARVAVEVVRKYGSKGVVLLNHEINGWVEDLDIKRFKKEVAAYLDLPITQANYKNLDNPPDQFDICMEAQAFKVRHDAVICTSRLKTEPFMQWLAAYAQPETIIYYGFDQSETTRIQRRSTIMAAKGYRTAYPLAHWPHTIQSTEEIGIKPPLTYSVWKHANCVGCIKGRKQHWYAVFVHRPDVWIKAKKAEEHIDHSIQPGLFLAELEPLFEEMKAVGVVATEHTPASRFWVDAKSLVRRRSNLLLSCQADDTNTAPCECTEGGGGLTFSTPRLARHPNPPPQRLLLARLSCRAARRKSPSLPRIGSLPHCTGCGTPAR